ncbi:MAG: hypothetical protein M3Q68_03175 [Actinomycetota bacterium]|nr:hypothetical protein [Actinomycetota bacterium]
MRRILLPLAAVIVLLFGACADEGSPVIAGDTTTSSTPTTIGATTSTAPSTGGFATTTVSTPPLERGLLQSVAATADGGVDRVTFTFEGPLPGYRIGYIERPIIQDGSGEEITVDGAAVLGVHFEPASGFDLSGEGRQVYAGPNRLDLATRRVLDVVRTGDFEANLEWAVGVDVAGTGFRVRTASAPNRIVLEVEVPPGS